MRRLRVNRIDLEAAFETNSEEMHHYLDTQTGEVLLVGDDFRQELEDLMEAAGPKTKLDDLLLDSDLPDWHKRAIAKAQRVAEYYGTHVMEVPKQDARENFRDMEAFVATVAKSHLRAELQRALEGRGPFRRFKDVLAGDFRERDHWFQFQRERLREHMTNWLASLDIAPVWEEPPAPRPEAPVRSQLLTAVLAFVKSASSLAGVKRIALIGSLAAPEPSPKDVDLLVTVTDDMDLAPLAKAARQLNGRAMQTGRSRGGDVFLADASGNYLGRTCLWKECGPGIRQSCDARHCGQRHYLHDDLRAIKLQATLIQAPPIELWPAVVPRVAVPPDVEEVLLKPIRQGTQNLACQRPSAKPEAQHDG